MTDIDGFLFVTRIGNKNDFIVHFADGFHVFTRVVQLVQEVADTVQTGAFLSSERMMTQGASPVWVWKNIAFLASV